MPTLTRTKLVSIRHFNELMLKETIVVDLAYIVSHLSFMPATIKRLEEPDLPLTESLSIMGKAEEKINSSPGQKGLILKEKMNQVLRKNPGLKIQRSVGKVHESDLPDPPLEMSPRDISQLKYCPMTSCNVERSFSSYKNILSDKPQCFVEENLSKVVICHAFYNRLMRKHNMHERLHHALE